MIKKEHKFFDAHLDNNLDEVKTYLDKKLDDILAGKVFDIDLSSPASGNEGWHSEDAQDPWTRYNGTATQLLSKYNLLKDNFEPFQKLHNALKNLMLEACEYYEIDFDSQNYQVMAWFNYDYGKHRYDIKNLHDHNHGLGIPDFHGYYCVDAEPSVTHYQIGRNSEKMFENINKDNRLIISETGHPHSRGDWNDDRPRITIAYDILPYHDNQGDNFVKL